MIQLVIWGGLAIASALALAFGYVQRANAAQDTGGTVKTPSLRELFQRYAKEQGIDPLLPEAIATVESSLNPAAVRNNPPRDISVGVMQILCIPDERGFCTNRFNGNTNAVDGWDGMTFERLKDPEINVAIGVRLLAYNLRQYGFPRGVAVYNMWAARHADQDGPFPNQSYVDKVLKVYARLKEQS